MSTLQEQISQLEDAIAAQESVRAVLGDTTVDSVIAALRDKIQTLRAPQGIATEEPLDDSPASAEMLKRFMPQGLMDKARAAARRSEGERKQVTILYADLCGFTALSERADPETLRTFQNDLFSEMAGVVYQHEGFVEKFVGDAIMSVFGAPIAHEDDPDRALRAALTMRSRMTQLNDRWAQRLGQALSLHIGINTGTVVTGNLGGTAGGTYAVTGDTVNTAARLQAAAAPGQILVGRDTYRVTREAFEYTALESIPLKGKSDPVLVYELERAKLLPERTRGLGELGTAFAGREQELKLLLAVGTELEAGRGRIVSVNGDAGIGKSRLLKEWRKALGERVRWVEGRAFAHTTSLAYGPFIDMMRRFARINDDDSETEARARLNSAIDQLLPGETGARTIVASLLGMRLTPEDAEVLATLPAEVLRGRIYELIRTIFERLARERPTLLVIEDLHWADAATLELLESLLPLAGQLPLALVGARRLDTNEAPSKLRRTIEAHYPHLFTDVALTPLSEASSLLMAEQILSTAAVPAVLQAIILRKAEGNPFFVEEVIRVLIERGALMQTEAGWVATPLSETVSVPDTVRGVLMARLDALPDETKWIAQQSSVIGRVFLYRVLLQIAEHNPSVEADLTHLAREELILERTRSPETEFVFKHALTQEVAYQSMLTPRRRDLHRKVGEALSVLFAERLGEVRGIIGDHFFKAEAWASAVDHLISAGDAAARLFAYSEAAVYYSQALTAVSNLPETADSRARRVDVTWKLASVSFAVDPTNNLERLQDAESIARQLLEVGSSTADRVRMARVQYWIGRIHFMRGEHANAIRYFKQVLAVAQEVGDADLLALPSSVIGRALAMQGRWGQAEPLLTQAVAPLQRLANWYDWVATVVFLGAAHAIRGRYAEGIAEAQAGLARANNLHSATAISVAHMLHAAIFIASGDAARMLEASNAVVAVSESAGERLWTALGYSFQGWAQSRLGDHAAALSSMAKSKAVIDTLGGRVVAADWLAAADAEIALNAGRTQEALALASQAAAFAQETGGIYGAALAARTWAQVLVRSDPPMWEDGEARLAESLRLFEEGDSRLEVARTHVIWGDVCRARGDVSAASGHYRTALEQFEMSGLASEASRLHQLLQMVGTEAAQS